MKEKGFTLIELLAVIVILAIIALIATPIVLNIIEDSKNSSRLNSANHYLDAVANAIMKYNMNNGGSFVPKECKVQSDGNLKCDGKDITIEVDGEKPTSGTIKFDSGKIDDVGLSYGDKYIVDNEETGLLEYGEPTRTYKNGESVYYNVSTGKACLEGEAVSTAGTKSGCMKFYAFNDADGNKTLNMILDHNTTNWVTWDQSRDERNPHINAGGPAHALVDLYNATKNWVGTITPENYTIDQSIQPSGAKYTIEYSKIPNIEGATEPYKARLITAKEIAQITGADIAMGWNELLDSSSWYYFQDLSQDSTTGSGSACISDGCTYAWLYDRLVSSWNETTEAADSLGYWTVSSVASGTTSAWAVYYDGRVRGDFTGDDSDAGVRPVIEVLKSNLSE